MNLKNILKKTTPLLLIFSLNTAVIAQSLSPELHAILEQMISEAKRISYYSNTVDWNFLENYIYANAEGAKNIEDLKPAFESLINGLGDHHGAIRKASDFSFLAYFTDYENFPIKDTRDFDSETWAVVNDTESRFEYKVLPNHIGYLRVVGIGGNVDGQSEADRIRSAIKELNENDVKNWIVDLRYNGGGNANVMMSGLAPLFDTKKVVGVQNADQKIVGFGKIKKGNYSYFETQAFEMDKKPKIKKPKIAVLTSRWTVSSGELVAIAFKGQKNTRFFGEYSGGLTTNNSWELINDEIMLIISTGVFCDRNGISYLDHVPVDEEIQFIAEPDLSEDQGIQNAVQWLLED